MKNPTTMLCCIAGLWLVWLPSGQAGAGLCEPGLDQMVLRTLTSEDGLPFDAIYDLRQDSDGFLWIGTEDGLARYDGRVFERIALDGILGDAPEFIESLELDAAGAVYAGTSASGIVKLNQSAPHEPSIIHPMRHLVRELLLGDEGIVLAGSRSQGLLQIADGGGGISQPAVGRSSTSINSIARRSAGGYWVGYAGDGLQWFDGDAFHPVAGTEALSEIHVTALLEDRAGVLWIGSREALFSFDGRQLRSHGQAEGLEQPVYALSLLEDSHGQLWVGLGGGGVARRCGDHFETLSPEQGMSQGRVNNMLEDREDNIWFATGDGLVRLRAGAAVPLTSRHGLPGYPVLAIIQSADRSMWIGTFGGGVARLDDNGVTIIDSDYGLLNDRVLALAVGDGNGDGHDEPVWVGTHAGLSRIIDGAVERSWTAQDGLPHDTVISLLHDDGRLWIGTVDGLAMFEGETFRSFEPEDGFDGYIIHLFKSRDGTLWIGTDGGGLFRMRDQLIEAAPFADDLPGERVTGLHETDAGILWVSTSAGVLRWDGEHAGRVGLRHGLPDSQIFSIIEDGLGAVWMSGNRGVFRVEHEDLEAVATGHRDKLDAMHFTIADGMPRSETNGGFQPAVWRDHRGRLWYPTSDGAAIFDPHALDLNVPAPKPVLRRITSVEQELDTAASPRLGPLPEWIEFAYSAPTFTRAAQVEFRYRLAGYDADWFTTTDNSAMYRRLPAGQYAFQLQARKPHSDWSAVTGVELTVDRYWLHSPWTWIATALLMLGALFVIMQRVQRRREFRRQKVMQAQKLEAIGLMAGGIAHDFNNVLSSIMSGTEMLADEFPPNSPQRRQAERIIDSAENGSGLTRQLLAFARRQPVEPDWLDLSEQVNELREFLNRLLTADIRLDWQIDAQVGYCHIDKVQLQQVLINLVVNARDAMPEGGELRVELSGTTTGPGDGFTHPGASHSASGRNMASLTVTDTGIGISKDAREHIFEPFFTTKKPGRGTGLGLSVSYGIIQQAGGSIEVESEPGKGTRFRTLLPVRSTLPAGQRASE